ncbi:MULTISPECIES: hypothetical protein [unclassified Spirosoma]|uniref:hypothetical protein n=1 Tax=unclassified Spirosoma TaxID=2621999 RepID=UPI00095DEEFA|nr:MULTISPECIES: hypothetical protein [unclassified Spirosoma]MBN8821278.1 hypothetical protein [Spirosoma sp.]OJW78067.1 MAG: hypothetical protein BGO59_29045 [Spirosoma sp. 48-14]
MADKKESPKKPTHVVVKEFRDKDNFDKIHEVGSDVSHFDEVRLAHLVSIGHVEGPKEPEKDPEKKPD